MRVVFMGSPDFALPSLHILAQDHELVAVVTQPDRPAGRGRKLAAPPVKIAALQLGIPVLQPISLKDADMPTQLKHHLPDVIVVAAYGKILPPAILELPPHGCVNVHASLLPRWRGGAPAQAAILHGDQETGVSIMRMDAGLDTGPIIAQRRTDILPDEIGGALSSRLASLGAELLAETLSPYCSGDIALCPQDDEQATFAPLLKKSDGLLDWRKTSLILYRQVRAFEPWPGSFFCWKDRRIAVRKAHSTPMDSAIPGRVTMTDDLPSIGTEAGLLVLDVIQPAGRKPMPASSFLHGAPDFAEAKLDVPD
jgi:methionyl-tRNA formyltransferase